MSNDKINYIYDKTKGYCFYCGKKLAYTNYGKIRAKGSWEIDHGRPRSKGGTDHLNNLHAACVDCNRDKGDQYPWYCD